VEAVVVPDFPRISPKIEEGFTSAERGELLDPGQVRAKVNDRKRAWRNEIQR
jgi:hypothetical protein